MRRNLPLPILDPRLSSAPPSYEPQVGQMLTVEIPGERIRAPIVRVLDSETVVIEVQTPPMARAGVFRVGDIGIAKRSSSELEDFWFAREPYREPPPPLPVAADTKDAK